MSERHDVVYMDFKGSDGTCKRAEFSIDDYDARTDSGDLERYLQDRVYPQMRKVLGQGCRIVHTEVIRDTDIKAGKPWPGRQRVLDQQAQESP